MLLPHGPIFTPRGEEGTSRMTVPSGLTDCTRPEVAEQLAALRLQVQAHITRGALDAAEALCRDAVAIARGGNDPAVIDRTSCDLASMLVALGRGDEVTGELRKILMRSFDLGNRFVASYALSKHYDLQRDHERSWTYARQALRYAEQAQDRSMTARAHNHLANLYILDSYFDEARGHYQECLDNYGAVVSLERAVAESNLGYCLTILGKTTKAFRLIFDSLRLMTRLDAGSWKRLPHLSLAYAYLEIGRYDRARHHAERGLHFSENTFGAEENVKNALYMLGEAEKLNGRSTVAYEHFCDLQRRFYPDQPFILDVLMSTDLRKMINLMA